MFNQMKYVIGVLLTFFMVSESSAIGGANIGNEVPSARAAGQGYVSIAAQNDDPSTIYSNPAGITKLNGTQLTYGFHWENLHGRYETDAGNKSNLRSDDIYVPNISMTQSFMDGKLGAGLSVQSPFGLETHWASNGPLNKVATDSRLGLTIVSPAIAYQVLPVVSLGVGADYVNVFNTQLDKHLDADPVAASQGFPSGSDAVASLRGSGVGWGYHAGILIEPNPQHAIGLTYHNKVKIRINGPETLTGLQGPLTSAGLFGGSTYSTSANTDLNLPANLQLGYAYKPTAKWLLEADAAWVHWSGGSDLNVRFAETNPNRLGVLRAGDPIPLDERDAWGFAAGVNYKASDKWQYRGGFWYEPWALPESTFTPAFMDLSRYGVSTGFGYAFCRGFSVDVAYTAVFFHSRTIHNDVGMATTGSPQVNGIYKNFVNNVALNVTHRFGSTR